MLSVVDVDGEQVEVVVARALVRLERDQSVLGSTLDLADQCTCNAHAMHMHMQCTCTCGAHAHAACMRRACGARAACMPCACRPLAWKTICTRRAGAS